MFTFSPLTAALPGADLVRKNLEYQLSMLMSVSGKFFNASLQLSELNRQASNRLLEESAADMQKALQIHNLAEAQSFIGEQSKSSVEKVQGYWQNVQKIAADNWVDATRLASGAQGAFADTSANTGSDDAAGQQKKSASHAHEEDVQASPLVEKLIANVEMDAGKAGLRP